MCFVVIAFARGFKCYGGYMMVDYLTEMKRRFLIALLQEKFNEWAEKINKVPTDNYSTGMYFITTIRRNNLMKPAGTIDIIAKGGLAKKDIEKITTMKMETSSLLGLPDIYCILYKEWEQDKILLQEASEEIQNLIGSNLIEINLDYI